MDIFIDALPALGQPAQILQPIVTGSVLGVCMGLAIEVSGLGGIAGLSLLLLCLGWIPLLDSH